ncbi:zinc finger domain-containing protein [Acaryochloris sp. IP29b_bin.148]|uniref:zinc finger domain-containing protein n=1 Tax=Acaryochloris sp. IP29b_bin.148 TaxID=2969218 RepID=UPI002633337D|nr:zinc finger domain-containing protein [Acaryochloris sp. IP29b_bin.148]
MDELRYLFLASQVELLDTPKNLDRLMYQFQSETLGVGVVTADGKKCDRCWNYSTSVGQSENMLYCAIAATPSSKTKLLSLKH